jgi:uncharacterized membrane protein YkoI
MHLSAHPGRVTAGLVTVAAVAFLGGTATVVATRTGSRQAQYAQAVAAADGTRLAGAAAEPTVTQRPRMPTGHPLGAKARPARPARALTAAQAVALAVTTTKARPDEVDVSTGQFGTTYDVKLVRADGSEVDVEVVARTGQVSVTDDEDQAAHADERSTGYELVPNEAGDASDD